MEREYPQNSAVETIEIERKTVVLGAGRIETLEPFQIGEIVNTGFLHITPDGKKHKGNVKIIGILQGNDYDDSGKRGFRAIGNCVMPDCDFQVQLKVVSPNY